MGTPSFPMTRAPLFLWPHLAAGRSPCVPPASPLPSSIPLFLFKCRKVGLSQAQLLATTSMRITECPQGSARVERGTPSTAPACPHALQDPRSLWTRRHHGAGPAHPSPGAGRGLGKALTGPPGSVGRTGALPSSPGCAAMAESPSQQLLPAPCFPPDAASCLPPRCPFLPVPAPRCLLACCLVLPRPCVAEARLAPLPGLAGVPRGAPGQGRARPTARTRLWSHFFGEHL